MKASGKVRGSLNASVRELTYHPDMVDRPPNNVKAWRLHIGMTQQELGDALGVAKSVISDLERGVVQINDKWLRRLAPIFKTQPGHILDYAPEDVDSDIIDIWAHIDLHDRSRAADVLRQFVKKTGTNN